MPFSSLKKYEQKMKQNSLEKNPFLTNPRCQNLHRTVLPSWKYNKLREEILFLLPPSIEEQRRGEPYCTLFFARVQHHCFLFRLTPASNLFAFHFFFLRQQKNIWMRRIRQQQQQKPQQQQQRQQQQRQRQQQQQQQKEANRTSLFRPAAILWKYSVSTSLSSCKYCLLVINHLCSLSLSLSLLSLHPIFFRCYAAKLLFLCDLHSLSLSFMQYTLSSFSFLSLRQNSSLFNFHIAACVADSCTKFWVLSYLSFCLSF